MEIINGKAFLRVEGRVYHPGQKVNLPDKIAEKLSTAGMVQIVEKATVAPGERAVKSDPVQSGLNNLTVTKLKELCRSKELPIYGTKAELIARLEGD